MNSADMPLYNDLSAMKERHDTLKMQIHDLQQQLKIVKNSIQDQFEETARMQLAQQGKDSARQPSTLANIKSLLILRSELNGIRRS